MTDYISNGLHFSTEDMLKLAFIVALDKKATNSSLFDLRPQSNFIDYFLTLTALNLRQAYATADAIKVFFKKHFDLHPFAVDGLQDCNWILMDYGSFFVHIFQESSRTLYRLEELWNKATPIMLDEGECKILFDTIISSYSQNEDQRTAFSNFS